MKAVVLHGCLRCSQARDCIQLEMFALQVDSARKLLDFAWLHVLPGHGRPAHFSSIADRSQQMEVLLQAEK